MVMRQSAGGWYAISSGPIRLIVLNTNLPALPSSPQTAWLTEELSSPESKAAMFRVIVLHVPPFVTHWDKAAWANGDGTASEGIRRHWVPLFERHHVDLVISGHSHIYQRGMLNKVMYTIIGGGGGALETEQVCGISNFVRVCFRRAVRIPRTLPEGFTHRLYAFVIYACGWMGRYGVWRLLFIFNSSVHFDW
jgi:hypothetical protein